MLEGERGLDDPRHPRCGIQVPHVRLYRTNRAITGSLSGVAECLGQREDLDGVANRSP